MGLLLIIIRLIAIYIAVIFITSIENKITANSDFSTTAWGASIYAPLIWLVILVYLSVVIFMIVTKKYSKRLWLYLDVVTLIISIGAITYLYIQLSL